MKEPICPVTGREDMIDDCHITIEFGYGSDKDLTTYTFSPVHDIVGKKVLELIQSMMPCGSVEEFGEDVMDEYFGGKAPTWEEWDKLSAEEKAKKKKEWGME
jgi:hypothetical protein